MHKINTMLLCMLTNFSKLGKSTKLDKNGVLTNFLLGGLRTQTSAAARDSGPANTLFNDTIEGVFDLTPAIWRGCDATVSPSVFREMAILFIYCASSKNNYILCNAIGGAGVFREKVFFK